MGSTFDQLRKVEEDFARWWGENMGALYETVQFTVVDANKIDSVIGNAKFIRRDFFDEPHYEKRLYGDGNTAHVVGIADGKATVITAVPRPTATVEQVLRLYKIKRLLSEGDDW